MYIIVRWIIAIVSIRGCNIDEFVGRLEVSFRKATKTKTMLGYGKVFIILSKWVSSFLNLIKIKNCLF